MTSSAPRRRVTYLRVSVTDRCNERCVYCLPAEGAPLKGHADILRFEEIARLVRAAVPLGVRSVRLTGGEPLVRRGIVDLAATLAAIPGVEDLALTTNGTLLAGLAVPLRRAGVNRLNVSLDTLDPDRYRSITRTGRLDEACEGLEAALAAGFKPIKINTVIIRGVNDDEIEAMARRAAAGPIVWRFIELMPLGEGRAWGEEALVPADEIVARLSNLAATRGLAFEPYRPADPTRGRFGAGPARYFRFGAGLVGVISPMTHGFCARCNRLRLTADGRLHPCLTSPLEIDVAGPLRAGAPEPEITALLERAATLKPEAHRMRERRPDLLERRMSRIGG